MKKKSTLPTAILFKEISETQPKTSDYEILEPIEGKSKSEHFSGILPYNFSFYQCIKFSFTESESFLSNNKTLC